MVRPQRSPRRSILPRLAPVAAALVVGALIGSLVVGGPWQRPEAGSAFAATDVVEGISAAAARLDAYQASFAIDERHLSPDVPERHLAMRVWFEAPERFRLDVVDHTDYPTTTTPTDLKLVVDGSTSYAAGPSPCPTATCPQRESVVRNRLPFSTAAAAPTDLVLPISTLADADRLTVLGRGTVLGRPAVRVEVPFERAEPLFPFLSIGGDWRPFFPNDRVRIWLDERNWFPLRWNVYPATGAERDAWALRFGLPDEPSLRSVFSVRALHVSLDTPDASVFDIPATASAQDQGARAVELSDVRRETGFEPVAPGTVGGLDRYRVVLPRDDAGETLVAYADGLAFLNLGETRSWNGDAPFGPVGVQAEEVPLTGGGVAYYEPASQDHGRRIAIHAAGTDLYLESNLPRSRLLAAAAALPVQGLPMPAAWTLPPRRSGDRRTGLARDRPCVRPVPDRAPERAARRVRARERGAGGRRVRCRGDAVPEGRGRRRRHRHDPAAPRGRERAAAGDVGRPVDGGRRRPAGAVHPRPFAARVDRRRPVPVARRARARARRAPRDRDLDRRGRARRMSRG